VAALRRGTCDCGRTLAKMSKVTGRIDDMLVVRGVNVYPSEVERVLLAEAVVAPDYLLVLDQRGAESRLVACCEFITGGPAGSPAQAGSSPDALQAALQGRLREALGLSVAVRVLPPGSVPRSEVGKAVRVVRWTTGEPPVPGLE
jgi:phenylacetate-CoA ligase